jgi:hypothetical protein
MILKSTRLKVNEFLPPAAEYFAKGRSAKHLALGVENAHLRFSVLP